MWEGENASPVHSYSRLAPLTVGHSAPPLSTSALLASSMYLLETNGRLEPHLRQEWLLPTGLGGFASSTVVGCNTRRYHGVLVAATLPPVGRVMALNRIGEILKF